MAPVDLSFLSDFAKAYNRAALRNRHDPREATALAILKARLKEENDRADSERRIFELGGGAASDVATHTPWDYGGSAVIQRREQEAKQRTDELAKIAAEGGSSAAERFANNLPLMFNDPSLGSRSPLAGETEIGTLGRLYGVPFEGQSATVPPWEGSIALKNKLALTHEAEKRKQERALLAEEAAGNPELNPILAPMFKTTPEAIGTLRKEMPVDKLLATGRLAQGAERVNQGQERVDQGWENTAIAKALQALREAIQAGGTPKSAADIANTQANTGLKGEQIKTEREMRPIKVEGGKKRNEQIGKEKPGKAPTQGQQLVTTYLNKIRALQPKPGQPGWLGTSYGSTPGQDIEAQVDTMKDRAQDAVTRRAIDIAWDQYLQEQMEGGGGQGVTTAPAAASPGAPRTAEELKRKYGLK